MANSMQNRDGGQDVTPLELLTRLWHHKIWALLIIAICVIVSVCYLQKASRLYEIQANLLLQPGAHGLRIGDTQNGRPNAELIATHSEILASRKLITRAVESYLGRGHDASIDKYELTQRLMEELSVKRVVGTRVLNVSLRCADQAQGKALVENLFAQYQQLLYELNQGGQVEALSTLAKTEQELRAELSGLQQRYRDLRASSPLIGDLNAGLAPQQNLLDELGTAYAEVRSRRISLENRLATVTNEPEAPRLVKQAGQIDQPSATDLVSTIVEDESSAVRVATHAQPITEDATSERGWGALHMLSQVDLNGLQDPATIQQELFQAEVRRQELVKKYREKHPELQAVDNQIADWKRRLQTLVDRAPLTMERELRAAKLQEDHLKSLYDEELATAKQLDQHRLRQLDLQGQIAQVQTLHDSVMAQLTDLRLNNEVTTEGGADLRVTVLDEPVASIKPVWPNEKLVLGGGMLMGLLGTSVLMLIPVRRREQP
ncbi:exopolysaccharide biosynthesis protein [Rhodopirellula maiorica SM1]|uniref:Exopolysaccharide biosynthesis protein n=1 Tax=Rhodopirellula maiorica SM1 TaxID=1265738 RepID=M5RR35_9BACT|nr:Wzz/FepE/Etk N-terminal domain-containing protein [Rhodopirellula maiorica]EMI16424.1 exopolysaccharide biosynthesis protein [Rhodopirellula maiorica SM1]